MGAVLVTMRIVSKLKYSWSKTVMKMIILIVYLKPIERYLLVGPWPYCYCKNRESFIFH